jgi:hypothetical protein
MPNLECSMYAELAWYSGKRVVFENEWASTSGACYHANTRCNKVCAAVWTLTKAFFLVAGCTGKKPAYQADDRTNNQHGAYYPSDNWNQKQSETTDEGAPKTAVRFVQFLPIAFLADNYVRRETHIFNSSSFVSSKAALVETLGNLLQVFRVDLVILLSLVQQFRVAIPSRGNVVQDRKHAWL